MKTFTEIIENGDQGLMDTCPDSNLIKALYP